MSYRIDASGETGTEKSAAALLGLAPLLVMSTTVVDALGLAILALTALAGAGVVMISIRDRIAETARWPASMLAVGLCTSTIMLLLEAFAFDLYERIAFLVPLVITNVFVLARLDRAPPGRSLAINDVTAALGAAVALVIVGAACEAIGHGTLLDGTRVLAAPFELGIRIADSTFPMAATPPGAFIIAGLLLAARNARVQRR